MDCTGWRWIYAQGQNRGLKKRVDKLQTLNNTLKTDMAKVRIENDKEIKLMKKKMSETDSEHRKTIQNKDREIQKLKLNEKILQTDRIKLRQEFEGNIQELESQQTARTPTPYVAPHGDDQDILEAIAEYGDDVDLLKQKLLSARAVVCDDRLINIASALWYWYWWCLCDGTGTM